MTLPRVQIERMAGCECEALKKEIRLVRTFVEHATLDGEQAVDKRFRELEQGLRAEVAAVDARLEQERRANDARVHSLELTVQQSEAVTSKLQKQMTMMDQITKVQLSTLQGELVGSQKKLAIAENKQNLFVRQMTLVENQLVATKSQLSTLQKEWAAVQAHQGEALFGKDSAAPLSPAILKQVEQAAIVLKQAWEAEFKESAASREAFSPTTTGSSFDEAAAAASVLSPELFAQVERAAAVLKQAQTSAIGLDKERERSESHLEALSWELKEVKSALAQAEAIAAGVSQEREKADLQLKSLAAESAEREQMMAQLKNTESKLQQMASELIDAKTALRHAEEFATSMAQGSLKADLQLKTLTIEATERQQATQLKLLAAELSEAKTVSKQAEDFALGIAQEREKADLQLKALAKELRQVEATSRAASGADNEQAESQMQLLAAQVTELQQELHLTNTAQQESAQGAPQMKQMVADAAHQLQEAAQQLHVSAAAERAAAAEQLKGLSREERAKTSQLAVEAADERERIALQLRALLAEASAERDRGVRKINSLMSELHDCRAEMLAEGSRSTGGGSHSSQSIITEVGSFRNRFSELRAQVNAIQRDSGEQGETVKAIQAAQVSAQADLRFSESTILKSQAVIVLQSVEKATKGQRDRIDFLEEIVNRHSRELQVAPSSSGNSNDKASEKATELRMSQLEVYAKQHAGEVRSQHTALMALQLSIKQLEATRSS